MIIREFSERDIEEITDLMKSLCKIRGQDFDETRLLNRLMEKKKSDSNKEVIVALDKDTNQVLGMSYCSIRNSENGVRFGYISNLIVVEEKRRTGIGENLMRHMIDYFKRNHVQSIQLALKTNLDKAAKILFTKLGFEEIFRVYEIQI